MKATIELSVHQLVDFLLRKGDIDNRVFNRSSMSEGSRLHTSYQSKQGVHYISEYPLKRSFVIDEIEIVLQGRADGIIKKSEKDYIIDEIKTTVVELKDFRNDNLEWHLGQAKCYAYMFAKALGLDHIGVRLTYIRQGKESEKLIDDYSYITEELEKDIYDLLNEYIEFYNVVLRLQEKRNVSIANLSFPFKSYRKGQKDLIKYVYGANKNKEKLFIEAPTGIGKTMSLIYPSIKYLSEDDRSKIFYLTAKTTGKENAHKAINILREKGLELTSIVVTSKEKICFTKEKNCNPDECPFARGYYTKIKDIIKKSIIRYEDLDFETITHIAKKHEVCPFELELDLSLFSDVIICDYNYVYDPISYMKRYFDEDSSHYIALVDEAHNLVDRSRGMYSAFVSNELVKKAREGQRHISNKKIKTNLSRLAKLFSELDESYSNGDTKLENLSEDILKSLTKFVNAYQDVSKNENKDISKQLTELYLEVNRFMKIYEFFNERFLVYIHKEKGEVRINLFCMDASRFLLATSSQINYTVYFSATLSPMNYYVDLLGGSKDNPNLILESPFPKENLKLLIAPKISTRYRHRENTYQEVANYLLAFTSTKKGNYFIYLPSYEYLEHLLPLLDFPGDYEVHIQNKDMSENEKTEFINKFKVDNDHSVIGLAIIGGAFGEGIDLVGDSLIGVAVVGIGLPKINFESDQIVEYFKENEINGFNYAYTYPGMNKVMQAVGRLIRSETDKGAALLIDERYMWNDYRVLFKKEWDNYEVVMSTDELVDSLQRFFKN